MHRKRLSHLRPFFPAFGRVKTMPIVISYASYIFFMADLLCICMKFMKCWEECAKIRSSNFMAPQGPSGSKVIMQVNYIFCIFSWQFCHIRVDSFSFLFDFFSPMCVDFILRQFSYAILFRCGLVAMGPSYPLRLYDTGLPLPGLGNSGGWFGIFVTILYIHTVI